MNTATNGHLDYSIMPLKMLPMIEEAIRISRYNIAYYDKFSERVFAPEDMALINKIKYDEIKFVKILENIHIKIKGHSSNILIDSISINGTLLIDLKVLLFRKIESMDIYKDIYLSYTELEIRDMLFEIITDCNMHIQKFNYLHNKYNS